MLICTFTEFAKVFSYGVITGVVGLVIAMYLFDMRKRP